MIFEILLRAAFARWFLSYWRSEMLERERRNFIGGRRSRRPGQSQPSALHPLLSLSSALWPVRKRKGQSTRSVQEQKRSRRCQRCQQVSSAAPPAHPATPNNITPKCAVLQPLHPLRPGPKAPFFATTWRTINNTSPLTTQPLLHLQRTSLSF